MNRTRAAGLFAGIVVATLLAGCAPDRPRPAAPEPPPAPVSAFDGAGSFCYDDAGRPVPYYDDPSDPRYEPDGYCAHRTVMIRQAPRGGSLPGELPSTSLPSDALPIPVPGVGVLRR